MSDQLTHRSPRMYWLHQALAELRLLLLYGLTCGLILAAGLLWRTDHLLGHWLFPPAPAGTAAHATIPFAGVTVELLDKPPAEQEQALAELRQAGFGWVRQRFDWGRIEPQPGVYDWEQADRFMAAMRDSTLEVIAVLDGSPAWARAPEDMPPYDNPLAPPLHVADFADFAAAFAQRYGSQVRFYQVWDEPNVAPHWGDRQIEPVGYAQLIKTAAPAIHSRDADAVIVAAALAPTVDRGHTAIDEAYFLQRMAAAGAGPAVDVVAIQPFGFGNAPGDPRQAVDVLNFQRAAYIRRALVDMGWGDKPVWAVRTGWNRQPNALWGAVTPQDQARYATEAYDLAWREWPWLQALGWAIDSPAAPPNQPVWGFALRTPTGQPTAVLDALSAWIKAPPMPRPQPALPAPNPWPWLALAVGLGLVAWRGWAAACVVAWTDLAAWWRERGWLLHAAAWAGLLVVYYFATWPPIIGLCWIAWALLAAVQPGVGLGLAALLLPFYFQHKDVRLVGSVLSVPPATAATLCLLPALLLRVRRSSLALAAHWLTGADWIMAALLPLTLLASIGTRYWLVFAQGAVELVVVPLGLWFATRLLAADDPRLWRRLVVVLGVSGALVALWGMVSWLRGFGIDVDGVRRLVGPHYSPNQTALYLVRSLFVMVGLALAFSGWWRYAWAGAAMLTVAALLLTGSRGALLLGLPAGVISFALLALAAYPHIRARLWRYRKQLLLLGVLGVLAAVAAVWLILGRRLMNIRTAGLRYDLWEAALRLWRDRWLAGVGPGNYFWAYPAYLLPEASVEPNQLHPHNLWLEMLVTWGLLGLGWFVALVVVFVRRLRAWRSWLTIGLVAALVAALAHAQADAFWGLPDTAGWNALALALLWSAALCVDMHSVNTVSAHKYKKAARLNPAARRT